MSSLGVIRLGPNVNGERLQKEGSPLNITVIATDDGGCCEIGEDEQRIFHRSEAIVRIGMTFIPFSLSHSTSSSFLFRLQEFLELSTVPDIIIGER